jgi:hypothetical protein
MSLDFSHVRQPTDREPKELPPKRPRHRPADRGLPDSWWANEAYDLPLHRPTQLAHSEELENSILDVLEPVMIRIEHSLGMCNGEIFRRVLTPWYLEMEVRQCPR